MIPHQDELDFLRPHMTMPGVLSAEAFERLAHSWSGENDVSFASYLAQRGVIGAATARTLDAIRKGYVQVPMPTVMRKILGNRGPSEAPTGPAAPASAPLAASPARAGMKIEPHVGMRLGKYVLQEKIGQGSKGIVFRAYHEALGASVAIKILSSNGIGEVDPDVLARALIAEGRLLHRLRHPNIISVLDLDLIDGVPYAVFEYGGPLDLEDLIETSGRIGADSLARIAVDIAQALAAATAEGCIHRDVKPANIVIAKNGSAKLADFGVAITAGLTQPQGFAGTPSYVAPEQIVHSTAIDHRADMYAFGATLYHAAVGSPPFVSTSFEALIEATLHKAPRRIRELNPNFDESLERVIMRLLEKSPDDRYATWAEVLSALRTARERLRHGQSLDLDIQIVEPVEEEAHA